MTKYVLLEHKDGNWQELARLEGSSATGAARKYVDAHGTGAIALVAIPERSFRELRFKVEAVRRVSIEGVGSASVPEQKRPSTTYPPA